MRHHVTRFEELPEWEPDKPQTPLRRIGRLLWLIFVSGVSLFLLLCALNAQRDQKDVTPSALPEPAAPASAATEEALMDLIRAFPGNPFCYHIGVSDLSLRSASLRDLPFEDGVARVLTIACLTPEGLPVEITDICPARALNLLDGGYHVEAIHAQYGSLTGVIMTDGETCRFHAIHDDVLIAFTFPLAALAQAEEILRSLVVYVPG